MSENEILVTEQVAENVEQTTEETPKMYTEAEMNAKMDEILGKKIARREAKIRKEYERKYGSLEEVLKAGTGKESVEEMTDTFAEFYRKKGIQIPEKPTYSAKDIEVLARAEANEIIGNGMEDVVEEVDRLAAIGVNKMTAREKAVFKVLAEHRQSAERTNELKNLGVSEELYNSKEFADFAGKFNPNTPIKDIYDIYNKTLPKKEFKTMGSMKNSITKDSGVKEFYTRDEALKFTQKDFDKNPALFKAVENSMLKW
jgi:3-methyladenine DNA glycosylase AlkC